jgi:acylphosphatase
MKARVHILIRGRVQGVSFRREITDLAHRIRVAGWVRNLLDGRVEITAEGEKDKLDELIQFCRTGPVGARVKNVDADWSEFQAEFRGFRITQDERAVSQGTLKVVGEADSS